MTRTLVDTRLLGGLLLGGIGDSKYLIDSLEIKRWGGERKKKKGYKNELKKGKKVFKKEEINE